MTNEQESAMTANEHVRELAEHGLPDDDIARLITGQITINQARETLGLPPVDNAVADALFCVEPYGIIPEFHAAADKAVEYFRTSKIQFVCDFWEKAQHVSQRNIVELGRALSLYPFELYALEDAGAAPQDIADILTAQATVNQVRAKMRFPALTDEEADVLFMTEPAAVVLQFSRPIAELVLKYWQTAETQRARNFWENTKDARKEIACLLLKSGMISQQEYDFLTAD